MELNGISGAIGADSGGSKVGSATGDLQAAEFMQLLAAQLANQDPLNPMEDTEFAAQLAQFSALEEQQATRKSLESLVSIERLGQAATLIGQEIENLATDGTTQTGWVEAARLEEGELVLDVSGAKVPGGAVIGVRAGIQEA